MLGIATLRALTDAGVAQQPSATPAFDVASVKPSATGIRGWSISYTADSLRATNATLSSLIQSAYGIREDRLVGGSNWVRTMRFDVNGKAAQAQPREQLRLMARRLLEHRFALAYAPLAPTVSAAVEPGQSDLPSVFVAVDEQLGLKLERNPRGSVEYVIIAEAHAPTEN